MIKIQQLECEACKHVNRFVLPAERKKHATHCDAKRCERLAVRDGWCAEHWSELQTRGNPRRATAAPIEPPLKQQLELALPYLVQARAEMMACDFTDTAARQEDLAEIHRNVDELRAEVEGQVSGARKIVQQVHEWARPVIEYLDATAALMQERLDALNLRHSAPVPRAGHEVRDAHGRLKGSRARRDAHSA